jgi:hypothetical protein
MSFYITLKKNNDSNTVLFVCHSIVTAQTILECFGVFIVFMSTVSNVNITFGCIQFVSHKSHIYTLSIFMAGIL